MWRKRKSKRRHVIPELTGALASYDARVREEAAAEVEARDLVNDAEIAPYYVVARQNWTRAAAIGEPALKPLIMALQDSQRDSRWAIAIALGEIGRLEAIGPLTAALKEKGREQNLRWAAARALGAIGHKQAVPALLNVLEDDDSNVRKAAVDALGQIGDQRALSPLMRRLEDISPEVREATIQALTRFGPAVVHLLIMAYEAGWRRESVVRILGAVGDQKATGLLLQALTDISPAVRRRAAWALGEIGAAQDVDALYMRAVMDGEREVRHSACLALAKLRDPRAAGPLAQFVDEGSFEDRIQAIAALGELGSHDATATLVRVLEDTSITNLAAREAAAAALGKIGDRRAIKPLQQALDDPMGTVREAARLALDRLQNPESRE